MFCINVWLTVKNADDVAEIRELLAESARLSRQEPGCVRFEVYHSQQEPTKLLLCERWESQAAWETHREGRAVTEIYKPKVLPRVDREPHFSDIVSE